MVGLDVGIQTGPGQHNNKPLIIVNSVGLIVMAFWSWLACRAVKHEDRVLAWVLTVLLPIMYILPIVDIVLGTALSFSCLHICDMHDGTGAFSQLGTSNADLSRRYIVLIATVVPGMPWICYTTSVACLCACALCTVILLPCMCILHSIHVGALIWFLHCCPKAICGRQAGMCTLALLLPGCVTLCQAWLCEAWLSGMAVSGWVTLWQNKLIFWVCFMVRLPPCSMLLSAAMLLCN